jgi:hypothetical protein
LTDFVISQEEAETQEATCNEDDVEEPIGLLMVTQITSAFNSYIQFQGIALDTCANYKNNVGEEVFRAMQIIWPKLRATKGGDTISVNGVGGKQQSVGSFHFSFVFGGLSYKMPVYVIPGRQPLVMCHSTMNDFGLSYHSYEWLLIRVSVGYGREVTMINGLPFLSVDEGFETLLSEADLRRIHRNLGHASVSIFMRSLEVASLNDPGDRAELEKIAKHCRACQLLQAKPKRFRVSLREDVIGEFNLVVMVDVLFLPG